MALNNQEIERLKQMKAQGLTFDQAMAELGGARIGSTSTVSHLVDTPEQPKKASYLDSVIDTNAEQLNKRIDEFGASKARYKSGEQGKVETGVQLTGTALATGVVDPVASIVGNIPGVKPTMGAIGKGITALSKTAPIKFLGGLIGNNEKVAEAVKLYDTDPQFKQTVNSATNIINAALTTKGLVEGGTVLANKSVAGAQALKAGVSKTIDNGVARYATTPKELASRIGIQAKNGDTSASIMNRVARVNPSDAQKFEKLSGGETIGEYLARTGNTNAPKELLIKEAQKFLDSRNSVDDAFRDMDAQLGTSFADGTIDDAISALQEKAALTSTKNVPSPIQGDLDNIVSAYTQNGGLNMEQINILKRLYEKHVKLGYNKLLNGNDVVKSTSLDNALREFQFKVAKENGFSNIADINKQTQLSKFIVDKLGDKLTGQTGLNAMSLTDVILLAGGDTKAVAAYLTKKFFGSKAIQAKIAEMLNTSNDVELVKPNYAPSIPIQDATKTR